MKQSSEHSDLCSICGEEEALIFVKVLSDDSVEEKGLCARCAIRYMDNKEEFQNVNFIDSRVMDALEEMRTLLGLIVSNISKISTMMQTNEDKTVLKCFNCGLSYNEFREVGYFGCPSCYQSFRDQVREIVLEIERGPFHKGKMPKRYAELFLLKKEVQFLKNQLKKSIYSENYEQADRLKKKLERLIGNSPAGKDDEIY